MKVRWSVPYLIPCREGTENYRPGSLRRLSPEDVGCFLLLIAWWPEYKSQAGNLMRACLLFICLGCVSVEVQGSTVSVNPAFSSPAMRGQGGPSGMEC